MPKPPTTNRATARHRRATRGPIDAFLKPHGLKKGALIENHEKEAAEAIVKVFKIPKATAELSLPTPRSLAKSGLEITASTTWQQNKNR